MGARIEDGRDRVIAVRDDEPDLPKIYVIEQAADIVIYTRAWKEDSPAEGDEKPNAMVQGRTFLNGREVAMVTGVTIKAGSNDFATVDLHLCPSSVKIVPLNEEEWKSL